MKRLVFLLFVLYFSNSFAQDSNPKTKDSTQNKNDSTLIVDLTKLARKKADTVQKKDSVPASCWKKGGVISLSFSQTSFKNWAAGGDNSFSISGLFSPTLAYNHNSSSWENTLLLAYGSQKQEGSVPKKLDDRIDFTTKYGYKTSKQWLITSQVNFKTQFADGFNYPDVSKHVSTLMAPAYLIFSLGMDYKPNDQYSLLLSPVTSKRTFVNDQRLADAGSFGVDKAVYDADGVKIKDGKNYKQEVGGYISTKFKYQLLENIILSSKLEFFSNYLEDPENIDVNGDFMVSAKINKYVSTIFTLQTIYDNDIKIDEVGPRLQLKETFGVGFSYNL
jgi:hypothetical protein